MGVAIFAFNFDSDGYKNGHNAIFATVCNKRVPLNLKNMICMLEHRCCSVMLYSSCILHVACSFDNISITVQPE